MLFAAKRYMIVTFFQFYFNAGLDLLNRICLYKMANSLRIYIMMLSE